MCNKSHKKIVHNSKFVKQGLYVFIIFCLQLVSVIIVYRLGKA